MSADEVLLGVAAWGLAGVPTRVRLRPLGADEWDRVLAAVSEQRLWGLLAASIADGDLPATDEQAARAEALHRLAMDAALELEAMAVEAVGALAERGVRARLLKGLAIAHLDELDPSLRCFSDVDLLVGPAELPTAVEVLRTCGYQRDLPERRAGFDQRFAKEATMTNARAREVDLHRSLVLGFFGQSVDLDDLWAASSPVLLAGRVHKALDPDRRLLHACYAAVLGDPAPRLVLLRDIGLLLTGGRVEVDSAQDLARSWRGEAVLAAGVATAADVLGGSEWPLVEWARSFRAPPGARRALRAYRSQGGTNTRVLLSGAFAPMSIRARAAYLRALVVPSREYARSRRRAGRPAEFSTGLRELLRRR